MAPSETPSVAPSAIPSAMQRATTLPPTIAPTAPKRATTLDLSTSTLAPTTSAEEMVYFTIQIDFFPGKEREPDQPEIEAMMCQTNAFFLKTLKNWTKNDSIDVYATNINWAYEPKNALPSLVEFFAKATYPDGSHVPAIDVFEAMEQVNVKAFVQEYIWQSEPVKVNAFYETEDIFFAGSYSGSPNPPTPHVGKLAKATCS
jgi:hypothetical protein